MRRLLVGTTAFLALTGTVLVLPVYAEPAPEPTPVASTTDTVDLGSVAAPAPEADVQTGPSDPVAGVSATAPTLTVTRDHTDPFSLVGVSWAYDPAVTDTVLQVRVRQGDGDWGGWTEVTPETADQAPGTPTDRQLRGGTSPLWTGPSTGVEVEVVTRSGAQPTDVQLDLVDPGTSPADATPGSPDITDVAGAAMAMPPVYSRAQWGADEDIRTWDPQYAGTIKAATIHHTADSNNYTADQVPQIMRSIYQYHAVTLGWGDIGYNVVVDKFGRMWEGRYGGLASSVIGAHAGGFNTYTFGVSMLGNYDVTPVPQAVVDSVAAIVAWKFSLYGVDPKGTVRLTSAGGGTAKYAAGTTVTLPTIFAHRDVGSTVCPGQYGYARMGDIRTKVAALVAANAETPQIRDAYNADPALQALLGSKTGPEQTSSGVTWQSYTGGSLYYSPDTGVVLVRGGVLGAYLRAGGPASLGAPTVAETALADGRGVVAEFQRGSVYWTESTGAHVVRGAIRGRWLAAGGPAGALGYPTQDEAGLAGGAVSEFERGSILWSPATDAVPVSGGIRAAYVGSGREAGPLGYPTAAEIDVPGGRGRWQQFQRGAAYWSAATGPQLVFGAIGATFAASGGATGPLGLPVGPERAGANAGRAQDFQGGSVYWKPATGAHVVSGAVLGAWSAAGAEGGPAGYPVTDEAATTDGGGRTQRFQSGSVYATAQYGAHVVRGAIGDMWAASGGTTGKLGYPTADEQDSADGSGRVQRFEQGGAVYWSGPTGAHVVRGDIATAYDAFGGAGSPLGLVTSDAVPTPDGDGRVQHFRGGDVYWTAADGAHVVRGAIGGQWLASGGTTGKLGFPVGDETDTAGGRGRVQVFQNGSVYWSASTGAHILRGDIATAHQAAGGPGGLLGLPTSEAVATADGAGRVQHFQGGDIYWSAGTGAFVVRGAIGGRYLALGGPTGRLGYPTGSETGTPTGASQRFQHGTLSWVAATSTVTVSFS